MTRKLHKGMVVEIFEDPLTCRRSEGKAWLLKLLKSGNSMDYWRVEFLAEKGSYYNRWIKKEES